jgi:hypothetical protein
LPTASAEVVNVALPELKLAVPSVKAPSRKVAVPVGVPAPGETALTVAVKVTDCPNSDGFTDEVTVVELLALSTVWVIAAEALLVKFVSPA